MREDERPLLATVVYFFMVDVTHPPIVGFRFALPNLQLTFGHSNLIQSN